MRDPLTFAVNRISAPRLPYADFLAMCRRLGVADIEIRNDLDGIEIGDGTAPAALKAATQQAGVVIRSINALYPFDVPDADLRRRARVLAAYARDCGAQALVMCPLNSAADARTAAERRADLVAALALLRPILDDHGVQGWIEPLGFAECALRRKSDAVQAIHDANGAGCFQLVHDTFHHYLAGEDLFFPEWTGLVHVSGVEMAALPRQDMRDGHRVLVGEGDRLGTVQQLRTLLAAGYGGVVSFEPFAAEIMTAADSEVRLRRSMDYLRQSLF